MGREKDISWFSLRCPTLSSSQQIALLVPEVTANKLTDDRQLLNQQPKTGAVRSLRRQRRTVIASR